MIKKEGKKGDGKSAYLVDVMEKRFPGWRWRAAYKSPPGQNSMTKQE